MKIVRIVFLVFVIIACTKESDFKSLGTVTGIDGTMCGRRGFHFPGLPFI